MALQFAEQARQRSETTIQAMAAITAERGYCLDTDLLDMGFEPAAIHDYADQARALAARCGEPA